MDSKPPATLRGGSTCRAMLANNRPVTVFAAVVAQPVAAIAVSATAVPPPPIPPPMPPPTCRRPCLRPCAAATHPLCADCCRRLRPAVVAQPAAAIAVSTTAVSVATTAATARWFV